MSERLTRRELVGTSVAAALTTSGAVKIARADRPVPPELADSKPERKFQLGMVTYNFAADWDLSTLIKRCKEAGFAGIELRTTHKHGVEPAMGKTERAEVKKQFADSGATLVALGSTCEFHSPDAAEVTKQIDIGKQFIELAVGTGARIVKVRPNGLSKEIGEEKTLEQIGRSLRTLGEVAQPTGVRIACEMHGKDTAEPARMRRIMEIANHPAVGVTWNSNGVDVKKGSVRESFEMMRKWVFHAHINELIGGYPYRELFTLMRQAGYNGYTMMELSAPLASKDNRDNVRFMSYYRALWTELSR
jgi:sugar phosphate isomerase/epimerase